MALCRYTYTLNGIRIYEILWNKAVQMSTLTVMLKEGKGPHY